MGDGGWVMGGGAATERQSPVPHPPSPIPHGRFAMAVPTTDSAMYQTIHRQPADLRRLLAEGWAPAGEAADRLATARRIFLVGIGTSYHAALVGSWLLRAAGSDARAINSFDFALYPDSFPLADGDAVVVMAHSGVKRLSGEAMARARAAG